MTTPIFSIVIPIYNTPVSYMGDCLKSILAQTFTAFEVLLVDDGSVDAVATLCDSFSKQDERIQVIHQTNQGVSAARNHGIEQANGRWILFVDADDHLEANACELLYEQLQAHPCDMLLFNGVREYTDRQAPMRYGLEPGKLYDMHSFADKELLYKRAMGVPDAAKGWTCIITYAWDKVYSRDFLMRSGVRFPVGLPKSEDKVFVLSCLEKTENLFYFEHVLYHYRMNDASICNRYSADADVYRDDLLERLTEIAGRMDAELGALRENPAYDGVSHELVRYTFGLISDVLLLKFYHKDNPNSASVRHRVAVQFISKEPYASSIQKVRYAELSKDAKLKKFLLSLKLVGLFCFMKKALNSLKGKKIASE